MRISSSFTLIGTLEVCTGRPSPLTVPLTAVLPCLRLRAHSLAMSSPPWPTPLVWAERAASLVKASRLVAFRVLYTSLNNVVISQLERTYTLMLILTDEAT